ncbi:bifunctional metallophosphatase/5'-nucleotidase [Pelomyxa schiedti]|nr:bifunctional metallophosphatase/5'-nucleotidase [Pelomyxa schiedti]
MQEVVSQVLWNGRVADVGLSSIMQEVTILHTNDLHGDFVHPGGGVAYLSGYIQKLRSTLDHDVMYVMAGDMLQGSPIDREFRGISTTEIVNFLNPVVGCIGNHEIDYGLPNLLWIEKLANFPLICANMYIKGTTRRLMRSHYFQPFVSGFEILFVGLVTKDLLQSLKVDRSIYDKIEIKDPLPEVLKAINSFRRRRSPIVIILSHLGLEEDITLAKALPPGTAQFIIGAHTHTKLTVPEVVNGVCIVQAGCGSAQVGKLHVRFGIDPTNYHYDWECVPIDDTSAPIDNHLHQILQDFETDISEKLNTVLCTLKTPLTCPMRQLPADSMDVECSMGNFFCDLVKVRAEVDLVLINSGSFRVPSIGPTITPAALVTACPFLDQLPTHIFTGAQLWTAFEYFMGGYLDKAHKTFQVSQGFKAVYNATTRKLVSLTFNGNPVAENLTFQVLTTLYTYDNRDQALGLDQAFPLPHCHTCVEKTSITDTVIEVLRGTHPTVPAVEGRLTYIT